MVLSLAMAVHRQGECWISRRYKRALTGTANGGRHKAMPCLAEEVLKAPVGQPAFQQLKGAAGFARIRARGRGRGSVGAACSSRKKPLDCRLAIQLSSNLLSSKAASLRGRPVFPCLLCVPTTSFLFSLAAIRMIRHLCGVLRRLCAAMRCSGLDLLLVTG